MNPISMNHLNANTAIAILWYGLLETIAYNGWMKIPEEVIIPSALAVGYLAVRLWIWRAGRNGVAPEKVTPPDYYDERRDSAKVS